MTSLNEYTIIAPIYDLWTKPFLNRIRKTIVRVSKIKKNDRVLEIGCGTGEQLIHFAMKGAIVIGIDLSKPMLKRAKEKIRNLNITLIHKDASQLNFKNNTFEISTATLSLHEMEPKIRDKIVKEMIRVTKPNGKIIIFDYTIPRRKTLNSIFWKKIVTFVEWLMGKRHYTNYKDFMRNGGLHKFVKKHKLRLIKETPFYGENGSIFILKK